MGVADSECQNRLLKLNWQLSSLLDSLLKCGVDLERGPKLRDSASEYVDDWTTPIKPALWQIVTSCKIDVVPFLASQVDIRTSGILRQMFRIHRP